VAKKAETVEAETKEAVNLKAAMKKTDAEKGAKQKTKAKKTGWKVGKKKGSSAKPEPSEETDPFDMSTGSPEHSPWAWSTAHAPGPANPSGVGYGGGSLWDDAAPASKTKPPPPATPKEKPNDGGYETWFKALALLLPDVVGTSTFDVTPCCAEMMREMLRRSPLMIKMAELLRNGAMEDISMRYGLYDALLDLTTTLCVHPATLPVMTEPLLLYPAEGQLLMWTMEVAPSMAAATRTRTAKSRGKSKETAAGRELETATPLIAVFQEIAASCEHMVKQADMNRDEFQQAKEKKTLAICRKCKDLADFLGRHHIQAEHATASEEPGRWTRSAAAQQKLQQKDMSVWFRNHCVVEVADEMLLKDFAFKEPADNLQPSAVAPGRIAKIAMDLAAMRTGLPEGVYVRHGESRIDVMKILITGPRGTPYEGGLFEFDLFCPAQFPLVPPKMQLKTTGGGRIRFNPNLYNNGYGKVTAWDRKEASLT